MASGIWNNLGMKSAEEWIRLGSWKNESEILKTINEIQLVAWRQGMTDAANIANKYGSDLNGNAQQIRNEIQHTRNSRTTP